MRIAVSRYWRARSRWRRAFANQKSALRVFAAANSTFDWA